MTKAATPPRSARSGRVVWIVNQYAGSPVHGMEFRHYELGRELRARGMDVVILSGTYSHLFTREPRVTGAYTLEQIDGLRYCWVRVPRYRRASSPRRVLNMLAFMARLYRLPRGLLPRPDVVIVSSPSPFPFLPAEGWRRRYRCALVFEVRDIWPMSLQELVGLPAYHPLVLLLRWFESRAYRKADLIVSLMSAAEPHFVRRGMSPGKARVIPNGVSAEALAAAPTAGPPDRGHPGPFVVGFAGTLGLANSIETLIEAARLLRNEDIEFRVVGHGPNEPELRALASNLPNVRFQGAVAKAEVPSVLRGFDAAYVGFHRSPLYRYGISPNKLGEYMAAGRPVILAADAANDIVQRADCGITVAPEDPRALADAILRLRSMAPAERARLGGNGRAYVDRELSYAALGARYAAALAEVLP
jgi:glycosyltransferase involved in cell wall biosynthesis